MLTLKDKFDNLIKQSLKAYFEQLEGENPASHFYEEVLGLVEKPLIEQTLKSVDYNQKKAACLLGINRNTLSKKIKQFNIDIKKNVAA
ncbi:MAG: Fis family transcriptional regulator [Proteobacteria bacterium]|nr:Fis family transcriptional regulator [Pseudomonadota bacterium]